MYGLLVVGFDTDLGVNGSEGKSNALPYLYTHVCMHALFIYIDRREGQDRRIARWPMLFFFVQYIPYLPTLPAYRLCVVYTEEC